MTSTTIVMSERKLTGSAPGGGQESRPVAANSLFADARRAVAGDTGGLGADEFLRLIVADRERAFDELVRLYRSEIFDLCVRIGGNRSEAEDLTQDTFLKAYENLGGYRGDAAPRSWLYRIAINRSISFTRRLKRWRMQRGGDDELFPELPELASPSSERETEERDLALRAHKELQHLPVRQRTAVVLRVIQDLPYEEVAGIMGTSVGGAKANVFQGLKKLRLIIEDEG